MHERTESYRLKATGFVYYDLRIRLGYSSTPTVQYCSIQS